MRATAWNVLAECSVVNVFPFAAPRVVQGHLPYPSVPK